MKKIVCFALAALMALSMAACGSNSSTTVSKTVTIEKVEDLAGKTIGVQLGTTGDSYASEYESQGATIKQFSKGAEAIQALKKGQVDCVVIDSQPAEKFVQANDDIKILEGDFFDLEQYAICLKKGGHLPAFLFCRFSGCSCTSGRRRRRHGSPGLPCPCRRHSRPPDGRRPCRRRCACTRGCAASSRA